jgi:hypothetical protein
MDSMRLAELLRTFPAVALALLISAPLCQAADEPTYNLRYQFQPGQAVYFTVRNESSRMFQSGETTVVTKDGHDSLKHYRVLSVTPEGNAELELVIDRTRMYAEQGDTLHFYDSTTDDSPPEAFAQVDSTVGRPWLTATVNNRGETIGFKSPDGSIVKRPDGTLLQDSPDLMSRVLPLLPEKEVAVGGVWKEVFVIDLPDPDTFRRPIRMQRTYRLTKVDGDVATIALSTQVITANKSPKQEAAVAPRVYSGTITLDMRRGLLLSRDLHVNQNVIGYDGPQTLMSIVVNQRDELAPAGGATPPPAPRTATVGSAAAER